MTLNLGTRNEVNIKGGPANIYIADAGAITGPYVNFSTSIELADFTALLANFDFAGAVLGPASLNVETVPANVVTTSPGLAWEAHHLYKISSQVEIAETDGTIINELVTYAEAKTPVDILFVKGSGGIGDYAFFVKNVVFTFEILAVNIYDSVDRGRIKIAGTAPNIADIAGQLFIVEDIPA